MSIEPKTLVEAVRYYADADTCHAYMLALKFPVFDLEAASDSAHERLTPGYFDAGAKLTSLLDAEQLAIADAEARRGYSEK